MNQASKTSLTICSVSFGHKRLLEKNIEYVRRLNPETEVSWVIVENTPVGQERFTPIDTENLKILEGAINNFSGLAAGSYHHALGLSLALQEVNTPYVLILDPDFFIVRKNWIQDVLQFMKEKELSFFGAPYNPKRYMKYKHFPCIHAMFVDLQKVSKDQIDFNPQYKQNKVNESKDSTILQKATFSGVLINNIKTFLRNILKRGIIIFSSRDTGYQVYEKFHSSYNSDTLLPVFRLLDSEVRPAYLKSWWNRMIEVFLPEQFSFLPKRGVSTATGFKQSGAPDVFSKNWDEFMWKGKPFGFHMQGARKDGTIKDHSKDMLYLESVLEYFFRQ